MKSESLLSTLMFLTLGAAVHGGELASPPPTATQTATEEGWHFRVVPYGWVTAIKGDMGIGPLVAPVDISMKDTLRDLDIAAMAVLEASYGRWSFGADITYAKTTGDLDAGGRIFSGFKLEQEQWVINPVIGYSAIDLERCRVEVFGGVRINVFEATLTGDLVRGGQRARSAGVDWVDPVVGLRAQADLCSRVFVRCNGDVGGFGAGSEFCWQAFAGLGYRITKSLNLGFGYRALGVDYSDGEFVIDTVTHGPLLGLELHW